MDENIEYLQNFEKRVQDELLKLCTSYKMLDGVLLSSEDVEARWEPLALDYMSDAVAQINEYPAVAVAWAGYMGMAVANLWDKDWEAHCNDEYRSLYGEAGFDDMDEHIVRDIIGLPLASPQAKEIEEMMRRCAYSALSLIRHEDILPQSPMAYYTFARTVKVMYRIGAAIELKRLGYKFEKVDLPMA
ncbi:MAG: hypothetical protein IKV23_07660 [Bacteroidaceae bacterium]|nr:hypothetical protein [Bacteroidaceae bacterium]